MVSDATRRPLVAIAGPTASGKTALALKVAERFGGEVVNCDSQQVYRGLDIGTAKLPLAERVGIPHHLIDIQEPTDAFTAGDFARLARLAIEEISGRGRLPVLAGGTGFYLKTLLEGIFDGPRRDPELRHRLRRRPPGSLHRILTRLDPAAAARIHAHDEQKLVRALEVVIQTRQPLTDLLAAPRQGLQGYAPLILFLAPPREALYQRINQRTEQLFDGGWLEEVAALRAAGIPEAAPAFTAHGYRQILAVLDGSMTRAAAIAHIQQITRNYAKRQFTWFRNQQPEAIHLPGFGDEPQIQGAAFARVGELLEKRGE